MEFVFVLREASLAKKRRVWYYFHESGLRPHASSQDVPQRSRVVRCLRVQGLQHFPWDRPVDWPRQAVQ
eukprot:6753383-Heterocapsa_arctica.AAC.1